MSHKGRLASGFGGRSSLDDDDVKRQPLDGLEPSVAARLRAGTRLARDLALELPPSVAAA